MSIDLLYVISAVLPLVLMPIVLPMVVLMAYRKNMTDSPSARKLQDRPVVVMGGTVMVLVMCITLIVINLFYDISNLFPIICVMIIMYILGMLDDNIGLSWQFKAVMQIVFILLLYVGGSYGVHSLFGLFNGDDLPYWLSLLLTLFVGAVILNAVNFIDGIDGLASALGILIAVTMTVWNIWHAFIDQALISLVMGGVLIGFFVYNVFSTKYKSYMGDSGSLVLGLYVYMSVCPAAYHVIDNEMLVDRYLISFFVALVSAMLFDFFRVVITRLHNGNSPFRPDRKHLHHTYVDLGMNHLLATIVIVLSNAAVIAVWYFTARTGMNVGLQFFIILLVGVVVFWVPYYVINYKRSHRPERYQREFEFFTRLSAKIDKFIQFVNSIIDNRKRNFISHSKE